MTGKLLALGGSFGLGALPKWDDFSAKPKVDELCRCYETINHESRTFDADNRGRWSPAKRRVERQKRFPAKNHYRQETFIVSGPWQLFAKCAVNLVEAKK
jgi:hypothetical protein